MKFAVIIIAPRGYMHSQCFVEVAETLNHGLRSLGYDSILARDFIPDRRHIVLGSNLLPKAGIEPPPGSILYNLEQIKNNPFWVTPQLVQLMKKYSVWDYSTSNVDELAKFGIHVESLVPVSYCEQLTRIKQSDIQDIDVLFIGSINERRSKILTAAGALGLKVVHLFGRYGAERDAFIGRAKLLLNTHFHDAKVLEVVRISYYLANKVPVLSEFSASLEDDKKWEGGLFFSNYGDLPRQAYEICNDDERRKRIAASGFDLIKTFRIEPFLAEAVNKMRSKEIHSSPESGIPGSQLCPCGSGRKYRYCHGKPDSAHEPK